MIRFMLADQHVNTVLRALDQMPYGAVAATVAELHKQIAAQTAVRPPPSNGKTDADLGRPADPPDPAGKE